MPKDMLPTAVSLILSFTYTIHNIIFSSALLRRYTSHFGARSKYHEYGRPYSHRTLGVDDIPGSPSQAALSSTAFGRGC
eukprot:3491974-Amphidinium_carterae.1